MITPRMFRAWRICRSRSGLTAVAKLAAMGAQPVCPAAERVVFLQAVAGGGGVQDPDGGLVFRVSARAELGHQVGHDGVRPVAHAIRHGLDPLAGFKFQPGIVSQGQRNGSLPHTGLPGDC